MQIQDSRWSEKKKCNHHVFVSETREDKEQEKRKKKDWCWCVKRFLFMCDNIIQAMEQPNEEHNRLRSRWNKFLFNNVF